VGVGGGPVTAVAGGAATSPRVARRRRARVSGSGAADVHPRHSRSSAHVDSLTPVLPSWSEGGVPDRGTVVLLSTSSVALSTALRHELAIWRCAPGWPALPLWFEEGSAVAAGEWDRLDALRLNWQVARGVQLDLDELDECSAATADAATATRSRPRRCCCSAVGGGHGLEPSSITDRDATLDLALLHVHLTEGDFEVGGSARASRYGWLGWASAWAVWAALDWCSLAGAAARGATGRAGRCYDSKSPSSDVRVTRQGERRVARQVIDEGSSRAAPTVEQQHRVVASA